LKSGLVSALQDAVLLSMAFSKYLVRAPLVRAPYVRFDILHQE